MSHATPFLPGLSPVDGLDIHARFDGGALSSDGGVLLLREIERKMGISDVLASCLTDPGAGRQMRTSLCKDSDAVPYPARRPRHSARAAERLVLKWCLLERLRS